MLPLSPLLSRVSRFYKVSRISRVRPVAELKHEFGYSEKKENRRAQHDKQGYEREVE
jgi:hypothetical protein